MLQNLKKSFKINKFVHFFIVLLFFASSSVDVTPRLCPRSNLRRSCPLALVTSLSSAAEWGREGARGRAHTARAVPHRQPLACGLSCSPVPLPAHLPTCQVLSQPPIHHTTSLADTSSQVLAFNLCFTLILATKISHFTVVLYSYITSLELL